MLFNSAIFAVFLPLVFALYWLPVTRTVGRKNLVLIAAGFVFYGWWDVRFLALLVFTALVDFTAALMMQKSDSPAKRRVWLTASIGTNIAVLGFFKYFNFFSASLEQVLRRIGIEADFVTLQVVLPVGISFYTFQAMSYTIEVFRGKMEPEKNIFTYIAYISFFPQLVAGPIERAPVFIQQFRREKEFMYETAIAGLRLMLFGLLKKVVIADNLSLISDAVFKHPDLYSGIPVLIGTLAFTLQIYFDFSGYSDIARGCARLFGFELMVNFRNPYSSSSLREFWSRWHISLSTWFRDYVYIPMGGNRKGPARERFNLLVTFILSGLWHGANLTFIVWGLIHGNGVLVEHIRRRGRMTKANRYIGWFITMSFVTLAWIFFRASSVKDAWKIIRHMFRASSSSLFPGSSLNPFLFPMICSLAILVIVFEHLVTKSRFNTLVSNSIVRISGSYLIVALILLFGVFHNAPVFIYFQF